MEYLTIKDVSKILGLGKASTYKLFALKSFPSIKVGNRYLVKREDFDKFMSDHKNTRIYLS